MASDNQENHSFKFEIEEKVLNRSKDGLLYEAKVIKRLHRSKGAQYFLHFAGWKKTYDEWIFEDKLLKYTPANLRKKEEILRKQAGSLPRMALTGAKKSFNKKRRKKKSRPSVKYVYQEEVIAMEDGSETPSGLSSDDKSGTADLSEGNEDEPESTNEPVVEESSVSKIMAACLESMGHLEEEELVIKRDRLRVLKECFDAFLDVLLTEEERPRLRQLVGDPYSPSSAPSDTYGLSHLQRFLGEMDMVSDKLKMDGHQRSCMTKIAEELSTYVTRGIKDEPSG